MLQTRFLILLCLFLTACTPNTIVVDNPVGADKLTIEEKLDGKTYDEKADIKGQELAKVGSLARTNRAEYDIEIVSISAIKGGVVVMARAWDKNGQIGFGKDGTVDIERFLIYNPPVLVQDPLGTIERNVVDKDGNVVSTYTLKEDTQEALLQVLEHTIKVKQQKFDDSKIIRGKVGNTTSTFYPAAGGDPGTAADCIVQTSASQRTWSGHRDATGDSASVTDASNSEAIFLETWSASPDWRQFNRTLVSFDTSSLSGQQVDSATYSLYGSFRADAIGLTTSQARLVVNSSNPASDNTCVGADFSTIGSVEFGSVAYADFSTTAYNNVTLNASGLANISTTGISNFGNRFGADFDDDTPTHPSSQLNSHFGHYFADQSGTTNDPKLVVEHSTAASARRRIINF